MGNFRSFPLLIALTFGIAACGGTKEPSSDASASGQDAAPDSALTDASGTSDALPDTKATDGSSDTGDGSSDGIGIDINSTCPGGGNCPCTVNTDCDDNICLEVADGHRCAIDCGGGACPDGFTCTPFTQGGGDAQYVCVQNWGRICEPCDNSTLCSTALGNEKSVCIAYGGLEGSFCGAACAVDGDCPSGYGCKDITSIDGKSSKQCARLPDAGGHIQCPCDGNATAQKLATTCNATVATGGSCPGVRACGSAGLGACTASPAAVEICDGIDNDCNGLTDDVVCDDKNLCTDDACVPASQTCTHTPNALVCTDGNACTGNDLCSDGTCNGKAITCDDQNDCTADSCDTKLGCQHENTASPCDDGDACTIGDNCIDGGCVSGKKKDCDDKNACTTDGCNTVSGICGHAALTGNACTDGSFCTSPDACANGNCVGTPVSCDDNNPCTADGCDPASGCTQTALATGCDDGNPCTVGDKCVDSVCISGGQKDCNDQNACTSDSCDTTSGACVNKPLNGAACDDGNACTEPDACTATVCTGATKNCDDSDSCTADSCDPKSGCAHVVLTGSCDDGNACTIGDVCSDGFCISGAAKSCDDGNPCTGDSCDPASGACKYTALTSACNDGNACTDFDTCANNKCAGVAKSCDDSNLCTDDSCDTTTGCSHAVNAKPCDDGNACTTGDTCINLLGGICYGNPINATIVCDDGNACTTDTCSPGSGCTYTPKPGAPCDDYNPCTQNDTCDINAVCVSGQSIGCTCQQDADCAANNTPCGGTFYCDKALAPYYCKVNPGTVVTCDTSQDGQCKATSCDPGTGKCVTASLTDTKPCNADSSVCTVGDACLAGACTPGTARNCDDGKACTDDSCDPTSGCKNINNTTSCSDGNACTVGDVCSGGSCVSGAPTVCNDNSTCTSDSCDTTSGSCVFNAGPWEGTTCDADQSKCTPVDTCKSGVCVADTPLNCDDGNGCTLDSCAPATGCVHTNTTGSCEDGNLCTVGDTCQNGGCVPGSVKSCDDSNVCTSDGCDVGSGSCVNTPVADGLVCPSGNQCLQYEQCTAGKCVGTAVNCDDKNPCTTDSCSPASGCGHLPASGGTLCDDGSLCTTGDTCSGTGASFGCYGTPLVLGACTTCDPAVGTAPVDQTTTNTCTGTTGCVGGNCWCVAGACKPRGCGDGVLDTGTPYNEQCDDGSIWGCDGCEGCQIRANAVFAGSNGSTASFGATAGTSTISGGLGIDGDMTIEMWINPSKVNVLQPILSYGVPSKSGTLYQTYGLSIDANGKLNFTHWPNLAAAAEPTVVSTTAIAANVWTHVAVVIAGQQLRMYVNGVLAKSATLTLKRLNAPTATLAVGLRYSDDQTLAFSGQLDELQIAAAPLYGAAFTPPRRVKVTAATRGLWHFDEGSNTTAADASGTAQKTAFPLTLSGVTWAKDACYGANASAGACGDGVTASASGSFPGTEECDDKNSLPCDGCEDCRIRRELTLGGSSAIVTPTFSSWAADAFCPTCEVTIELWAKLDAYDPNYGLATLLATTCASGSASPPCNGVSVVWNSDNTVSLTRAGASGGLGFIAAQKVQPGEWHHYAVELGWGNFAPTRLYIDGALATAVDIKPNQWDSSTPTATPANFTSETLVIGGLPMDPGETGVISLVDSGITPQQLTTVTDWQGEIDDVRVSVGFRYGNGFVPARRGYPDANTRALWHMDGATSTLIDDSGQGVPTINTSPTIADDCYAAPTNSAICGDGNVAPWEWDDGSAPSKTGNFPTATAALGLTCTPYWNYDCSGISWSIGDATSPVLTSNAITYPSSTLSSGSKIVLPWTWEGWVRLPKLPDSGKLGTIVAMDGTGGACSQAHAWAIQTASDGSDASTMGSGTTSTSRQVWKAGVWQHFALEYHGDNTGSLWVDGQKVKDFTTIPYTDWSANCKMHIGARDPALANHISGAMASLHMTSQVKYGAAFDPPWTLAKDASTVVFWDFLAKYNAACSSPATDWCASAVSSGSTSAALDIGPAANLLASGPFCPSFQPSP